MSRLSPSLFASSSFETERPWLRLSRSSLSIQGSFRLLRTVDAASSSFVIRLQNDVFNQRRNRVPPSKSRQRNRSRSFDDERNIIERYSQSPSEPSSSIRHQPRWLKSRSRRPPTPFEFPSSDQTEQLGVLHRQRTVVLSRQTTEEANRTQSLPLRP